MLIALSLVTFNMWVVLALTAVTSITLTAMVMTIVNGLSVLLSPKEAPGVLAGLDGACFGIGAGLGIALVAQFVSMGTHAGYTVSLLIWVGVSILAGVATLFLKRPEPAAEDTVV